GVRGANRGTPGKGECQRWRSRIRSSDRRVRRARVDNTRPRHARARGEAGPRHSMHWRRRSGRCDCRSAVSRAPGFVAGAATLTQALGELRRTPRLWPTAMVPALIFLALFGLSMLAAGRMLVPPLL